MRAARSPRTAVAAALVSPLLASALPLRIASFALQGPEGERVGTVEHTIHAALPDANGITLSELMVGGPIDVGELLTPTIGYQVTFGTVHGYVEAYGPK